MSRITFYASPGCPLCDEARDFLNMRGAAFDEVDIGRDPRAFHQMAVFAGGPIVPVIEVDGDVLVGFDRERLEEMIKRSDHPPADN